MALIHLDGWLSLPSVRFSQINPAQNCYERAIRFDDCSKGLCFLPEGIFLLKRQLQQHDLSIWIDCTFETALERAIERGQEGLPPDEATRAYQTIYFPSQRIHFEIDHPQQAASMVLRNDCRLASTG